jgi:hypothetical protein
MAKSIFYLNKADCAMAQDLIARDPDVYIEKIHYIGKGVYANSTSGISTLTPVVSPTWGADDFLSTLTSNLLVMDDNGKVCAAKVASNAADAITFDETACLKEEDELTAGTFTAAETYCFMVLTPGSSEYGEFFGEIRNSELTPTEESKKFVSRDPGKLLHKDVTSLMWEIIIPFVQKSSADFLKLFGLTTYGSQTDQHKYGLGPRNATDDFGYRMQFVNKDKHARTEHMRLHKMKFDNTGNWLNKGDSGYLEHPLHADLLANEFYAEGAEYGDIRRTDT